MASGRRATSCLLIRCGEVDVGRFWPRDQLQQTLRRRNIRDGPSKDAADGLDGDSDPS